MISQLIGSVMIIGSSTLFGYCKGNSYKKRVEILKSFRSSLQMLETEIIYGATSLPYAFKNVGKKICYPFKDFYECMSEGLLERKFDFVDEAWNEICDYVLVDKGLGVKREDVELIKGFGKVIGCSDKEDQKKHFDLFYVQINGNIDKAEEDRKSNEKIYKGMGFLIGSGLSILML
jgi:stage III sporulation protein AB